MSFFRKHYVLTPKEYGFKSKRSKIEAGAETVEIIGHNMNKNESSCCVFIELSKAFDTVEFEILPY